MPRKVGSSTNQYSRPSCSWPRGARVVCDTDTARCESSSSSALTRLDLPAPLGAATTNRLPGVSIVGAIGTEALDGYPSVGLALARLRIVPLRARDMPLETQNTVWRVS